MPPSHEPRAQLALRTVENVVQFRAGPSIILLVYLARIGLKILLIVYGSTIVGLVVVAPPPPMYIDFKTFMLVVLSKK